MHTSIQLYTADSLAHLPWPQTEDGAYAQNYLLPLIQQTPTHFIDNVQTHYMVLLIDGSIVLPVSVNEQEYENSYVCSPYTHYVTYAQEELVLIESRLVRQLLATVIQGFGLLCKLCCINQVIHINNWLLSTNLYPELTPEQIEAVITFLQQRFPRHTIIFRSINGYSNPELLSALRQTGCRLIGSRQVYLVRPADPASLSSKARWLLKRDAALIERHGYSVADMENIRVEDVPRLVELYNGLYLQKYSHCNPMFNEAFLRLALEQKILQLVVLKKGERIDAVLGYFCRNGVMTTPIFGYDMTVPREVGLYRMLSVVLFRIAQENGHLLHESSGAAQFKRNRGAVGEIEYSAVYDRHLPVYRRLCWLILSILTQYIGIPLMKKYRL